MSALLRARAVTLQVGRPPRTLVAALELEVRAGERWAVLGPNGAGKSTLLTALAGARTVQGGSIELAGEPLTAFDVGQLAERRAFVTDRWHDPFAATALDTVLTARYRLGDADAAGRAAALAALAALDCGAYAERDVRRLSRGERQRVAIATALAQDTPLLLLDEPIAHQDPRHQALVLDVLRAAGRTLLASLHDVNAALRFATHALLLTGSGAWQAGPAEELLTAPRLAALFDTPFTELPGAAGGPRVLVPAPPAASI